MRVFVTGANGFVGRHVSTEVAMAGHQLQMERSIDLCKKDAAFNLFNEFNPEVVIHLAAKVGGIGANQASPAEFWRDNLLMGVNVLEAARLCLVKRLIIAGTTCSYPKFAPIPFVEESLFTGYPEETNAPYGIAKLALLEGARAYRRQYGLKTIFLVPTNLYGPGDHFDLEKSHVIPAMIRKMHEAKLSGAKSVKLWGDGTPTRDFLYVGDVAKAFVKAIDCPDTEAPINLGSSEEVVMSSLVDTISKVVGYKGEIEWDTTKPNGQPRRCLDSRRAWNHLKWTSTTNLKDGLTRTYQWYQNEVKNGQP